MSAIPLITSTDFKAMFQSGDVTIVGAGKSECWSQSLYQYQINVPRELSDAERSAITAFVNAVIHKSKLPEVKHHDD